MRKSSAWLALFLIWMSMALTATASPYLPHTRRQKVSIRFLARSSGFRLGMSGGNQDVYLVLLSAQKGKTPVLAKLVDEYLYYQDEMPEAVLRSSKPVRLAVQRWTLCDAPASGIHPSIVYAPPRESRVTSMDVILSGELPCYKLDHRAVDKLNN